MIDKRPILFNLALTLSISIVLFAFEWKSPKEERPTFFASQIEIWDDTPDIPIIIQQLPPPPISSLILIEIEDDEINEKEIPDIDINI